MPKMLGSCNPAKNWVYKVFYKPYKNNDLEDQKKFIQALPTDNPHLPKTYLDALLSLDKNSRERLYYGNWEYDDDPSALIDFDAIYDYFNPVHIEKTGVRYLTIDVARKGKDKTIYRVWDGFLCVKRVALAVSKVNEVVDGGRKLMKEYNIPLSRVVADEDGVGGGVVDYLKCKGFVNNSRALNGDNYNNLKSQCSVLMAKRISERGVGEICDNKDVRDVVSEEMEQVKLKDIDKDGKVSIIPKDEMKEKLNRSPDDWDSIMMREFFELSPAWFVV